MTITNIIGAIMLGSAALVLVVFLIWICTALAYSELGWLGVCGFWGIPAFVYLGAYLLQKGERQ